jgi:aldose sugar dehydrogenase
MVETVTEGPEFPTTIAFLGPHDLLVLEKEKGTVQRIINGKMLPQPLLDINVATF